MKNIILVRHAKSDWNSGASSDFERPLNERGEKDAPKMAKRFKEKGAAPEIFISSPAKRAIATCKVFAKEMKYPEENIQQELLLYSGNTSDWLDIISEISDDINSAVVFGHNPVISHLVSVLLGQNIGDMPTCAVASIQLDLKSWKNINDRNENKILFIDYPKK